MLYVNSIKSFLIPQTISKRVVVIQLYLIGTGIAGHEFATTVCQGKAQAYLNKAASFHFPVNLTIKQAVEELAGKLGVEGNIF